MTNLEHIATLAEEYTNLTRLPCDRERTRQIVKAVAQFDVLQAVYFAQQVSSFVDPKMASITLTILTNQVARELDVII